MLSRRGGHLVVPLFGPGRPGGAAALAHDEQLATLDAARAAAPDGEQTAAADGVSLPLFAQRQGRLASLAVAVGAARGLGLDPSARAPLHLVFGVMAALFALVNANHAGVPGLGRHPRVSRHGRHVGIVFAPFWAGAAALNLWAFSG